MNEVLSRGKYTLEFKQQAVRRVKAGRTAAAVAKMLGRPRPACRTGSERRPRVNWVWVSRATAHPWSKPSRRRSPDCGRSWHG